MRPQSNPRDKVKSLHIPQAVVSELFEEYLACERPIHHVSLPLAQKQRLTENAQWILYYRCDIGGEHFRLLVMTENLEEKIPLLPVVTS